MEGSSRNRTAIVGGKRIVWAGLGGSPDVSACFRIRIGWFLEELRRAVECGIARE